VRVADRELDACEAAAVAYAAAVVDVANAPKR